jgi:Fur family iron response transcriptional regulator
MPTPAAVSAPALPLASEPVARGKLQAHGINCTPQRLLVARVLFAHDQHVSADQLLAMVRGYGARVSKATVYNTLNLFADKGLVRALRVDAERTVFDSNTAAHYHLHDLDSGELFDVDLGEVAFSRFPALPSGVETVGVDVIIQMRRTR